VSLVIKADIRRTVPGTGLHAKVEARGAYLSQTDLIPTPPQTRVGARRTDADRVDRSRSGRRPDLMSSPSTAHPQSKHGVHRQSSCRSPRVLQKCPPRATPCPPGIRRSHGKNRPRPRFPVGEPGHLTPSGTSSASARATSVRRRILASSRRTGHRRHSPMLTRRPGRSPRASGLRPWDVCRRGNASRLFRRAPRSALRPCVSARTDWSTCPITLPAHCKGCAAWARRHRAEWQRMSLRPLPPGRPCHLVAAG